MAAKSKRVSVSKSQLSDTALAAEVVGLESELVGAADMVEGVATLQDAQVVATVGKAALAAGASDLTRAADLEIMAERTAFVSEVVRAAGAADMAQGAEILAASQDIEVQSILISGLGEEDLRLGMEMGAIAGQLAVAADVVAMLDMPVLAEFLANRGDDLRDLAVDAIIKFGATRAMANTMETIGAQVGAMGADEMVEGLARRTVADAAARHSEDLAMARSSLCRAAASATVRRARPSTISSAPIAPTWAPMVSMVLAMARVAPNLMIASTARSRRSSPRLARNSASTGMSSMATTSAATANWPAMAPISMPRRRSSSPSPLIRML